MYTTLYYYTLIRTTTGDTQCLIHGLSPYTGRKMLNHIDTIYDALNARYSTLYSTAVIVFNINYIIYYIINNYI